jgi:quercetin dioxygenase-like cupin family protein
VAEDPTQVASHVYKTVFENDRVRILEAHMAPGDVTVMHSHPDHIAVAMKPAKFKFRLASGEEAEGELEAGQAMFVEAADHTTENTGSTELHAVLIELK